MNKMALELFDRAGCRNEPFFLNLRPGVKCKCDSKSSITSAT